MFTHGIRRIRAILRLKKPIMLPGEKVLRAIDFISIYRILLALHESPSKSLNVSELMKKTGLSPNTIIKYVEIMKVKGLIEERRNKERRFYITRKGEDFVFLFTRLLSLWGEIY